jgi:hypothetical protein
MSLWKYWKSADLGDINKKNATHTNSQVYTSKYLFSDVIVKINTNFKIDEQTYNLFGKRI